MGRKVHPIGFRLGINKRWNSRWFAEKKQYAEQLHEDREIRNLVYEENPRGSISTVEIERFPSSINITVHTSKPGIVIGRKGSNVKELRRKLQEETGTNIKLDIQEIEEPDLHARIVAENIAHQLERRISYRRAMGRAISSTMRAGAEGVKVMCSGRLSGIEMSRTEWMREGRVPDPAGGYRLRPDGGSYDLWPDRCQGLDLSRGDPPRQRGRGRSHGRLRQ